MEGGDKGEGDCEGEMREEWEGEMREEWEGEMREE